jgi:hypothetical protein
MLLKMLKELELILNHRLIRFLKIWKVKEKENKKFMNNTSIIFIKILFKIIREKLF